MFRKIALALLLLSFNTVFAETAISPIPNKPKTNTTPLPIEDVQRFTTALSEIKKYYVRTVDDKALFDNAIKGMLAGLDPHSSYLDTADFTELKSSTNGQFAGLGLEITSEDDYVKVVSPIDDTPAAKAGIKPGDIIVKIDDMPVKGMDLRDAVAKMRGEKGTTVNLAIYRKSNQKLFNVAVKRDVINVKSVKSKLLDKGYGYIRVSQFQTMTMKELLNALAELKKANNNQGLNGLILDLRNDPGGLLDSAINVADTFLDKRKMGKNDLIVYTKGRIEGSLFHAHATGTDLLQGAPMVVLINEGSASGAEIVAGALQDHRRAVIMGTNSFGKGSVQTVLPLDDKSALKLTTALYYTPNGRSIQATGIKPDITVQMMDVKKYDKDNLLSIITVREANLEHHFQTPADGEAKPPKLPNDDHNIQTKLPDVQSLATTDFQLYQALNLLKGLNVLNAQGQLNIAH